MEKRLEAAFGYTILHDVCAQPTSLPPKPDAPVSLKCSPIAVISPQSTALPPTLPRLASCHLCPKPCRVECGSPVLGRRRGGVGNVEEAACDGEGAVLEVVSTADGVLRHAVAHRKHLEVGRLARPQVVPPALKVPHDHVHEIRHLQHVAQVRPRLVFWRCVRSKFEQELLDLLASHSRALARLGLPCTRPFCPDVLQYLPASESSFFQRRNCARRVVGERARAWEDAREC